MVIACVCNTFQLVAIAVMVDAAVHVAILATYANIAGKKKTNKRRINMFYALVFSMCAGINAP